MINGTVRATNSRPCKTVRGKPVDGSERRVDDSETTRGCYFVYRPGLEALLLSRLASGSAFAVAFRRRSKHRGTENTELFFESQLCDPGAIRASTRLLPCRNAPSRAAATLNGTQSDSSPARSFYDLSLRAHRVLRGFIAEALPCLHRVVWNLNRRRVPCLHAPVHRRHVGCRVCLGSLGNESRTPTAFGRWIVTLTQVALRDPGL